MRGASEWRRLGVARRAISFCRAMVFVRAVSADMGRHVHASRRNFCSGQGVDGTDRAARIRGRGTVIVGPEREAGSKQHTQSRANEQQWCALLTRHARSLAAVHQYPYPRLCPSWVVRSGKRKGAGPFEVLRARLPQHRRAPGQAGVVEQGARGEVQKALVVLRIRGCDASIICHCTRNRWRLGMDRARHGSCRAAKGEARAWGGRERQAGSGGGGEAPSRAPSSG